MGIFSQTLTLPMGIFYARYNGGGYDYERKEEKSEKGISLDIKKAQNITEGNND